MTPVSARDVTWFDPHHVRFVEEPAPVMSSDADRAWDEMLRRNPQLFDGPITLCTDFHVDAHIPQVTWARATYRYRAIRDLPNEPNVSAVFVGIVQPTLDGRVVVGTTSSWTSHPARNQLPGGSMEPPSVAASLTLDALSSHAARELREETGVASTPGSLVPLCIGQMPNDNVGVFFVAEPRDEAEILERFTAQCAADLSEGGEPEFEDLVFVDPADTIRGVVANHVAPVLRRYVQRQLS